MFCITIDYYSKKKQDSSNKSNKFFKSVTRPELVGCFCRCLTTYENSISYLNNSWDIYYNSWDIYNAMYIMQEHI